MQSTCVEGVFYPRRWLPVRDGNRFLFDLATQRAFQDVQLGCPLDTQDPACGGAVLPELHRCDYVGDQDSIRRSLIRGVRVQRGFRREHGPVVGLAVWREQQSRSEV